MSKLVAELLGVAVMPVFWILLALTATAIAVVILYRDRRLKKLQRYLKEETDVVVRTFEVFDQSGYDEENPGTITNLVNQLQPLECWVVISADEKQTQEIRSTHNFLPADKDISIAKLSDLETRIEQIWKEHPWHYNIVLLLSLQNIPTDTVAAFIKSCGTSHWKTNHIYEIGRTLADFASLNVAILSLIAEEHLQLSLIHRHNSSLPINQIVEAIIQDLIPTELQDKARARLTT